MDQCWIEFSFPVPADAVDQVSDLLYEIGCIGLNVEERTLDSFIVPGPDDDLPERFAIKAYFPSSGDEKALTRQVVDCLAPILPGFTAAALSRSEIRQEDWAESWKQHFSATRFGSRLVVKPTWEEWAPQEGFAVLSLDPGMAFGTGSHETTRLCLQALAERFEQPPAPASVLDVGTGSGILAIAAALLGAGSVVGIEIDTDACRVAAENVALNAVDDRVAITERPLEECTETFDLVLANIMAEENVRLADQLVGRLKHGGRLILSGILADKEEFVRSGFDRFRLDGPSTAREGEWCCMIYDRSATA